MNILAIVDHEIYKDDYIDVATSVSAHVSMIWYRIKISDDLEILRRCEVLRKALPNQKLILSNNVNIAEAANFNGVHLNKDSYVGKKFPNMIIGYSAHSISECLTISADYYTLSPIFHVDNKGVPLGLVNAPRANVFALGGVGLPHYSGMLALGYAGIAGVSVCKEIINKGAI